MDKRWEVSRPNALPSPRNICLGFPPALMNTFVSASTWLQRQLSIAQMFKQGAECASIIGTSYRNGEHKWRLFHWRTADLTFIFHTETSFFTSLIVFILSRMGKDNKKPQSLGLLIIWIGISVWKKAHRKTDARLFYGLIFLHSR